MAEQQRKRVTCTKLVKCGHCNEDVAIRTYYQHRRVYFNSSTQEWSQVPVLHSAPQESKFQTQLNRSRSSSPVTSFQSFDDVDHESPAHEEASQSSENESDAVELELSSDEDAYEPDLLFYRENQNSQEAPQSDDGDKATREDSEQRSFKALIRLYLFFLFMFQTLFRISDTALDLLLKFMALFFGMLQHRLPVFPKPFSDMFPKNIKTAQYQLGNKRDQFECHVCCPGCNSLYQVDDCVVNSNGSLSSLKCGFVQFPLHPHQNRRKPCGISLMKEIKYLSGRKSFLPKRVFCYRSVITSLQELLKCPSFSAKCELWKNKKAVPGVYSDVYDGRIWNKFLTVNDTPFLSVPGNYALQINVDWFAPFKHTTHSEGAIYLCVLNLPRKERYLQENVMLIGVIPGPKEPSLVMNTFLEPLINELKRLWQGVMMKNHNGHSTFVRAALISCTCDIPASRKLCGFVSHNACYGCSKCLLTFPTKAFGEKPDYSNFDKNQWTLRTAQMTRDKAKEHKMAKTKAAQAEVEKNSGVRYTLLHELPYFDTVTMCCIDPMHNLLLGTAKHITEIWKSRSILTSKEFCTIQEKVDAFIAPTDVGRIPSKVSSGFSGFTADQWKNWIVIYSLYALKDVLPWNHYQCWLYFVKICFLLCRRSIVEQQLQEADQLLDQFWRIFKDLYGNESCTMNMHLHGHLTECIRDFGPVYSFWCFSYERMNGVLGNYRTNNRHISIQYMRRFLDSKEYAPHNWPKEFVEDYLPLLNRHIYNKGSLMQSNIETELQLNKYHALPPLREFALSEGQKADLCRYFDKEANGKAFDVLTLCQKAKALVSGNFVIGANGSCHAKTSFVLVSRRADRVELAEIQYFAKCSFSFRNQHAPDSKSIASSWFVCVQTYLEHPCKVWFGHPVEVWTAVASPETHLVPVTHINSRVAYTKCKRDFGRIKNDLVYVVVPLSN